MSTPQLGDFGVVATTGNWRIRLVSAIIRWDTQSPCNHAFVYVGATVKGDIIEARPGGAGYNNTGSYPGTFWSTGCIALTDDERTRIVGWAKLQQDVPYGWWDILCIAFVQKRWFRGKLGENWLWRKIATRVSDDGTLICSQLVDAAYEAAGVHLFSDGRPDGSVSPGDLYGLIRT